MVDKIKDLALRMHELLKYFDDKYGEDSFQSITTLRMFEILQTEIKEVLDEK